MSKAQTITEPTSVPTTKKFRQALPWWMQVSVLLVVFAAGGAVGAMVATKVIHSRMEAYRQHPPIFSEAVVARLRVRLVLSDEQATQIHDILERHHSRIMEYRSHDSQKMHTEFDEMVEEIAGVLGESQAREWQMMAEHVRRVYIPESAPRTSDVMGQK